MSNLLVDSVVDKQLCEHSSQEGRSDAQTKAAPGAVECPPQTQGQRCQC